MSQLKRKTLLQKLLSGEKDVSSLELKELRDGISLRYYQKVAIAAFFSHKKLILYDQMGFGKTLQSFGGFVLKRRQNPNLKFIYVTVKSGLLQAEEEFHKFFEGFNTEIIGKKSQNKKRRKSIIAKADSDCYFMSHRVAVIHAKDIIKNLSPYVLVLDEANYFKGVEPVSQAHKVAKVLAKFSESTWLLTADPVENSLLDAYGLMDIIEPKIFGDIKKFNENFCHMSKIKVNKPQKYRRNSEDKYLTIQQRTGFKNRSVFKDFFSLLAIGRTREDVENELPNLVLKNIYLDLNPEQLKAYNEISSGFFSNLGGYKKHKNSEDLEDVSRLESEIRCMQFLSCPKHIELILEGIKKDISSNSKAILADKLRSLFNEDEEAVITDYDLEFVDRWIQRCDFLLKNIKSFLKNDPIKTVEIKRLLKEDLSKQKVIIFSSYITVIDHLENSLKKEGYKLLRITGREDDDSRNMSRKKFTDSSDYNILLVTTAALRALNLQKASAIICHDMPKTWGKLRQLIGRIIRIGSQHKMVNLVTLLVNDTIDIKMYEKLYKTQKDVEQVLGSLGKDKVVDIEK